MAVSRIQIASNKKAALLKQNMREVAVMLSEDPPKEEKAKIRAEALIRDDNLIEAYEILQLECELLHERIKLLEYSKLCPPDLVSVVSTLIWAAHRVDIPELMLVRKQFRAKYGKQFEEDALTNANGVLNERVVNKLSVHPPAAYLVQTYLERICDQFEVDWTPAVKLSTNAMVEPMAAPVGYSVQVAQGTGLGTAVAVTGQEGSTDEEWKENYNTMLPPPPSPMTVDVPSVVAKPYDPNEPGSGSGTTPTADARPAPPKNRNNDSDFEEVDIYVPGAPSAPPGKGGTPTNNNNNKQDGDDDGGSGGGGGGATKSGSTDNNSGGTPRSTTVSYNDLAARFDQLKK